jgi:uncharacterized protein with PQ loop repeat
VSTLTLVSTLSVKLIGFPSQIRKVRKAGNLEGISVTHFTLGFVTYALWTLHGVMRHDLTVILGQGLGVVASGSLLVVLFKVSKRGRRQSGPDGTLAALVDKQVAESGT